MPLPGKYSSIDFRPLVGYFDTRSSPDAVEPGTWRWRQNLMVLDKDGLCRRLGWTKLFSNPNYNNQDYHDQLLQLQEYYADREIPYATPDDIRTYPPGNDPNGVPFCDATRQIRSAGRQPVTMLFPATSSTGARKLFLGTQNRICELNESTGNWRIIADKYGGTPQAGLSQKRWYAAQNGDTLLFTNNYDPLLSHVIGQPVTGCDMQAVSTIPSLAEIGLTKAGVVAAWRGVFFLADVEVDGERQEFGIYWGDKTQVLNFVPSNASTGGFFLLNQNERVLSMLPLGDVLRIYTTKSIWDCRFVGGAEVFQFTIWYEESKTGVGCLAYRNTIVSNGQEHYYLGSDGVYRSDASFPQPERVEWMHAASSEIYDTIDDQKCDSHCAWFDAGSKEYWISWVERGQTFPIRALNYNLRYHSDDIVDHGFTAGCTYEPDTRPTLQKWLEDMLICTRAELLAMTDLLTLGIKEGGFCITEVPQGCDGSSLEPLYVDQFVPGPTVPCDGAEGGLEPLTNEQGEQLFADIPRSTTTLCEDRNTPILTKSPKDIDGRLIEDYDSAADVNSLCAVLGGLTIEDLCQECPPRGILIMASAQDWSLKQYGGPNMDTYYRERCINCTPCGEYVRDGFKTILRSGALSFGWPRENKASRSMEVEFEVPIVQAVPSLLRTRIGYSAQAVDPNNGSSGRCALVWRDLTPKNLECLSDRSGPAHLAKGTRPNRTLHWNYLYVSRYMYIELSIDGINGACCFSRWSLEVMQRPRSSTS